MQKTYNNIKGITIANPSANISNTGGYKQTYIYGGRYGEQLGSFISSLGDIKGDGGNAIAIRDGNNNDEYYVLYGNKKGLSNIDSIENYLSDQSNGFIIYPSSSLLFKMSFISSAGDFTGDKVNDIFIGASDKAGSSLNYCKGVAYLIYGNRQGFPNIISIEDYVGSKQYNGIKITGAEVYDSLSFVPGFRGGAAGDINGDKFDDIIIGDPGSEAIYAIFGSQTLLQNIDSIDKYVNDTTRGFKVQGPKLGASLSKTLDVNGDNINDIFVGSCGANTAYIMYGRKGGLTNIESINDYLSDINHGFIIKKDGYGGKFGCSIVSVGDINGDGADDMMLADEEANYNALQKAGLVYVLYGNKTKASLANIDSIDHFLDDNPSKGIKIYGSYAYQTLGSLISKAGDIDGNGIDDIIIGSTGYGMGELGSVYVIYGREGGFDGNINSIEDYVSNTSKGFKIYDLTRPNYLPASVISEAGDIDDNGTDDIIIGVSTTTTQTPYKYQMGAAHIIYGNYISPTPAPTPSPTPTSSPTPTPTPSPTPAPSPSLDFSNYAMLSQGDNFKSLNYDDTTGFIKIGGKDAWCNNDNLIVADFDGDGKSDLLCNNDGGKNYIMLQQNESVSSGLNFAPIGTDSEGRISIGSNETWCDKSYQRIFTGDFNQDGRADLLCNNFKKIHAGQNYVMLSNKTSLSFYPIETSKTKDGAIKIGYGTYCSEPGRLLIGDFNGDKKDDLLCNDSKTGNSIMLSNGTAFNPASNDKTGKIALGADEHNKCTKVDWCLNKDSKLLTVTGDFNGDGKADLLCNDQGTNMIMLSKLNTTNSCDFIPNGRSDMGSTNAGTNVNWCDSSKYRLVTGDFNGDGFSDLICNMQHNEIAGQNAIMISHQQDNKTSTLSSINLDPYGNINMDENPSWCPSHNIFVGYSGGDAWLLCNQAGSVIF